MIIGSCCRRICGRWRNVKGRGDRSKWRATVLSAPFSTRSRQATRCCGARFAITRTQQRRPFVRFFACEQDLSHEPPDTPLPDAVATGAEPFLIIGAIAGGRS